MHLFGSDYPFLSFGLSDGEGEVLVDSVLGCLAGTSTCEFRNI